MNITKQNLAKLSVFALVIILTSSIGVYMLSGSHADSPDQEGITKAFFTTTNTKAKAADTTGNPSTDPASDIDPTTIPGINFDSCISNQVSSPDPPDSAACNSQWIKAINYARAKDDSLPPINININAFTSLSENDQEFIISNIEREDRGLRPALYESSNLNCTTSWGTNNYNGEGDAFEASADSGAASPPCTYPFQNEENSNVSNTLDSVMGFGNYNTPLAPEFSYLYDDSSANWGHRNNILYNYGGGNLYTGVGYGTSSPWGTQNDEPFVYYQIFYDLDTATLSDTASNFNWADACSSGVFITLPSTCSSISTNDLGASLGVNQSMTKGQYLESSNSQFKLVLESNGFLEIQNSSGKDIWAPDTEEPGNNHLVMQTDGNLVLYNRSNHPIWATGTEKAFGTTTITLQNTGELTMQNSSGVVWSSWYGIVGDPPATLSANQNLYPGQELFAADDEYRLAMQADGNLVIYNYLGQATWSSGTNGQNIAYLTMQSDGNLVLYNTNGVAVWDTQTNGQGGTSISMVNNGNLNMNNSSGGLVWDSADNHGFITSNDSNNFAASEQPAVITNAAGELNVFERGSNGALWTDYQTVPGGNWSGWISMGGYINSQPAVAMNNDGRLEVFASGTGSELYHDWQSTPGGNWAGWNVLGGAMVGDPAVAKNQDGRLEVFALASGNVLYHVWQLTAGGGTGWSGWSSLGGAVNEDPSVAMNNDGRLEIFDRGTNDALYHQWQLTPGGTWSGWTYLGGDIINEPTVGVNADGRLEVFAAGTNNQQYHIWQTSPGGAWTKWASLGGDIISNTSVINNLGGHLEIFAVGTNYALFHNWETPSGWSTWYSLGGKVYNSDAGRNSDGRLEVFSVGGGNKIYHIWQNTPGGTWSSWSPLD